MPFREPTWWYARAPRLTTRVLTPLAAVYGSVAERRMAQPARYTSSLPVICIGNFTAGGTGKTPLALWIARQLKAEGLAPFFLTRGYGSGVRGATRVDPDRHTARDAGDEALLLARAAPVMIAPDRAAGAQAIERCQIACDVIVMDDGLQNPALAKDFTIAVVDGARGIGNGRVIPAGPLRAPLAAQIARTDLILVNGRDADRDFFAGFDRPLLSAHVRPGAGTEWLAGSRVLAFAGIGNPERFFAMLEGLGATIVGRRAFADHHAFTDADAGRLLAEAATSNAVLATTEKDYVRLDCRGIQADLKRLAKPVPIGLAFRDGDGETLMRYLTAALATKRGA